MPGMESFNVQHSTQLFTKGNSIGFVRFDGSIAGAQCKSPLDAELVGAATDSMSAGHLFGLSKSG